MSTFFEDLLVSVQQMDEIVEGEELGNKLLAAVLEMKSGQAARVTEVVLDTLEIQQN